ncbi:MAG: PepSY domain-containing protein [Thermoguttaceae bacterium]|nr:PepSY domain-containing protein [Thermoguttaceae bacterium]
MKKYLRIAHRVLGFWCAAIFAVVCATGGVYAFREEIARIVEPERYYVDAQVVATQRRLPIDDVIAKVEAETNARAETILIPSDQRRTYNFLLKELNGRRGRALLCDVDPFTGEITGRGPNRSYPFVNKAMRRWHTRLNLPKEIGRPLVDFATYFSIFLILSGVALWIPKKRSQLKARLTAKLTAGKRRAFFDLHNALGIYTALPLLVLTITGAALALGAKHGTLATPLRIERGDSGQDVANEEANLENAATSGATPVALEEILRRDFERSRKTGDVRLRLPVDQNEQAIRIERKSGGCWACSAPDVAYWDGVKGTLIAEKKLRDATFDEQTKVLLREIHFGAAFGLGTKIIFGVASLAGAALAFFGIAIWAFRDFAPKKKAQTANAADVANEKEEEGTQTA